MLVEGSTEVRDRIPTVEGRTPPPGDYTSWADYMRDVERTVDREELLWHRRCQKAMRLAPTLEVFEALLAGQPVPVTALDPQWRRRYGL